MDDQSTYVGPTAAAKLAALAKAAAKNAITVDDQLYSQSTHPVQNKVVTAALGEKAGKSVATPYINGLMSRPTKPSWTASKRARPKTARQPQRRTLMA